MKEDAQAIDDVIVVAFGAQLKSFHRFGRRRQIPDEISKGADIPACTAWSARVAGVQTSARRETSTKRLRSASAVFRFDQRRQSALWIMDMPMKAT